MGGCYAERLIATRLSKTPKYQGLAIFGQHGPRWTGTSRLWLPALDEPLRIKEPSRIFVADMGDLFFEENEDEDIAAIFGVMAAAPQHTFQVLTKRPERMAKWFKWVASRSGGPPIQVALHHAQRLCEHKALRRADEILLRPWPLPNVWLGVSVETQEYAEKRIPVLAEIPAAVRFLSCEPLLGPLNLFGPRLHDTGPFGAAWIKRHVQYWTDGGNEHDVELTAAVDWVIVGSESGPGARAMDIAWAESIVGQCRDARVACFVKQIANDKDRKGGNPEHWPSGDWPREFPEVQK